MYRVPAHVPHRELPDRRSNVTEGCVNGLTFANLVIVK
jgi:hypothetical protein